MRWRQYAPPAPPPAAPSPRTRTHTPAFPASLPHTAPPVLTHPLQTRKAAAKDSGSRGGGGKAKKDPKAPKRALSAYMFFSQDWRERVKAENPDAGFGEIGKLLGARWKELSDEEKKVRFLFLFVFV